MESTDALFFFEGRPKAFQLYRALERALLARVGPVHIRVQKTQITLSNRRVFGCVSMMRLPKTIELPAEYIVVTFGLAHRVLSPRIAAATEPYPNRWTHHVPIAKIADIDDELMQWLVEAYAFSAGKR